MDATIPSILIVGGDNFLAAVVEQIHNLPACTVEVASNPQEATPLIQAQQPDLLILQASQTGSLELCSELKGQPRLAWIYCILMEDQAQFSSVEILSNQQVAQKAEALERGADACLFFTPSTSAVAVREEAAVMQQRLLRAQIYAGLRIVRNHREIIRTNDLLSAIALSDPLTELNNRRALEWELPRQIQNARTRSLPMSLVMLDVDFFKAINDTHGHLVGDRTLELLALRLRNNLRFYDTPFRYGGEEFVIILSNTDPHEAPYVARRLCYQISNKPFTIDTDEGVLNLKITISAGVASLQVEDDAKGTHLLRRADQNLLKAKANGRNRIVSCDMMLSNSFEED